MPPRRTPINWTRPRETPPLRPHPYTGAPNLPGELVDKYMVALVPGGLFALRHNLWRDRRWDRPEVASHSVPYLYHDAYTDAMWSTQGNPAYEPTARAGAAALYAGTVRVEEVSRGGRDTARFVRHTFIVGGARWMAHDLTDFLPLLT